MVQFLELMESIGVDVGSTRSAVIAYTRAR